MGDTLKSVLARLGYEFDGAFGCCFYADVGVLIRRLGGEFRGTHYVARTAPFSLCHHYKVRKKLMAVVGEKSCHKTPALGCLFLSLYYVVFNLSVLPHRSLLCCRGYKSNSYLSDFKQK